MRPELVQAAKLLGSNDLDSVSEALRLMQSTVYSFSMKVCGHPEDAEDTMQDVLISSLPHLAKIHDPKALAVWLYTATRHRCWRSRRKSVYAPKQTLSLDDLMPDDSELGLLLQDATANPESHLLRGEEDQLIHKAILSVPPQYRIVLVLHDMEDLNTEQIAQVLDIRPGTVRVRLHRARLYVRREMNRLLDEIPDPRPQSQRRSGHPAKTLRRPQECRELFSNLSEYLDGRVEAGSCEEMRGHIEACPACIAFLQDLRRAIDRCRRLDLKCDPKIAPKLRSLLTSEYLRMLGLTIPK
ncbi:MAG TPA: sigma-70 family RNA polymerase sigma factor [Acidisarcina sp.]|nr:sigma-70 family RNA polymerase sigma factor [Acidisarcina sp.]